MKSKYVGHAGGVALVLAVGLCAPSALAQYYPHPYLEAECPDSSTGSYVTRQTSVTGYSGAGYLRSAGNTTASAYNNTSADRATYSFNVKAGGSFVLWLRVNTNNSASDDSWFHRVDGSSWTTMSSVPAASGWRWVAGTSAYSLSAGAHTVEIANREDGLNVDKLAMLPQGTTPTGAGAAAYNCPTAMYFEAECRKGAFAGYQLDRTAKAGYSGSGYLESAATSLDVNTSTDEATYFFETGASAYNFFFRIHNNANASQDSWFYRVDSGGWTAMNNTSGLGSGFRWVQGTASATLTRGVHTLRIRNRESGLSVDKLAFIPTTVTGPSGTAAGNAAVNCEPFQTMSDWTYGVQDVEYEATHLAYMAAHGPHMLPHHNQWHTLNGAGGQNGRGSGTAFLGYHRAMMNDFRRFALETNGRIPLPISTTGETLNMLGDAYDALEAANLLTEYYPRQATSVVNVGIASYLTLSGAPDAKFASTVSICPTAIYCPGSEIVYDNLADYPDLDRLGRAIGSEYHGWFHSAVGGTMGTNYSPADPVFYGWHALIDKIVDAWLATPNGQAWKAANPTHPFLVPGFTNHHGWDNLDHVPD
ncbi:MAG: hypothetical protein K0R38_6446 [Polyangiaceae bacterium]|nr:hypothetical protein [Polyangiaceae bacterium]